MDHLQKLTAQVKRLIFVVIVLTNMITAVVLWIMIHQYSLQPLWVFLGIGAVIIVVGLLFSGPITRLTLEPLRYVWQAILHISPEHQGTPAPNVEKSKLGKELVTSLTMQVYQLASNAPATTATKSPELQAQMIVNNLPIPVIVTNNKQKIVFANQAAATYVDKEQQDIIGQNVYSVFDLSFPTEHTLERWLADSRANKVTASNTWDHIRLEQSEKQPKQLDLAAYYNKDNPSNVETIIVLFDRTEEYKRDDQAMGYVALAVHELRTPLTILRGYIEVFEEELEGKLDPELTSFMHKMQASAQQLSTFVNNILNVARVEENQLVLQLKEEKWADVVKAAGEIMSLRAQTHNKKITYDIAPNLPATGVDKVSIIEVIDNLLDNAIKYSNENGEIIVKSWQRPDGMVETTIQDFGIGMPASIMENLFEKFYRNHRSRNQVGGTGLGLYLSKAIVTAHGGEIWVRSKEGEGTTFGFTVQPYSKVAQNAKNPDNKDITRTAHGWIKNHSFYRR